MKIILGRFLNPDAKTSLSSNKPLKTSAWISKVFRGMIFMFFIIKKNHPGFLFVYFGKNDFMSTKPRPILNYQTMLLGYARTTLVHLDAGFATGFAGKI